MNIKQVSFTTTGDLFTPFVCKMGEKGISSITYGTESIFSFEGYENEQISLLYVQLDNGLEYKVDYLVGSTIANMLAELALLYRAKEIGILYIKKCLYYELSPFRAFIEEAQGVRI